MLDSSFNNFRNLTPFVTTHFRDREEVVKIEKWQKCEDGIITLSFTDLNGYCTTWYRDTGVVDASFEGNLQNILKE